MERYRRFWDTNFERLDAQAAGGTGDVEGVPDLQDSTRLYLRVEFHYEGGKTRLVLMQAPDTEEIEAQVREGWYSSFTELDTLLAS